jgi:hypothetical protein
MDAVASADTPRFPVSKLAPKITMFLIIIFSQLVAQVKHSLNYGPSAELVGGFFYLHRHLIENGTARKKHSQFRRRGGKKATS